MKSKSFQSRKMLMKAALASFLPITSTFFTLTTSAALAAEQTEPAPKSAPPSTSNTISTASADEQLIRQEAEKFARAYSDGNSRIISAMCAQDCTLTDAEGAQFSGRPDIEKMYERSFHVFGQQPVTLTITGISFPAPDVGIEDGELSFSKTMLTTRYSVVHIKRDGEWKMLRITESPYNPQPSEALKPLFWMIGDWTIHGQNKDVHLRVSTINNKNFLVMRFGDIEANTTVNRTNSSEQNPDELQIIGWSFKTKDIVSWDFGHGGGFGFGHWHREGENWVIETKGVTRDGTESTADYVIHHPDHDHFTWQSSGRSVNGTKLPNVAVVQATRVTNSNSTGK